MADVGRRRNAAEALRLAGPSAVRLLRELDDGLVLELVEPGSELTPLAAVDDDAATVEIARALVRFWAPVPPSCSLPTADFMCRALDDERSCTALPAELVRAAQQARRELAAAPEEAVVLHGDLHHGNLLWSERRGWVAIDPHGVVGERGYDVGPVLFNHLDGDVAASVDDRLGVLAAETGLARERLAAWGLVRAVLSEVWAVQDDGVPHGGPLAVARALAGH